MRYKNLVLIGSSHVSAESINEVKETVEKKKPHIIAVELDQDRLHALFNKGKRSFFIKGVGIKGMLFALIGAWVEKKIGKIVNVEPGSEMKAAVLLAKYHKLKLALIDQHINITLRRFSETFTWKEKFRFLGDIVSSIFRPNKQLSDIGLKPENLNKVPSKETIRKMLKYVKVRYPNIYQVLIYERNLFMANALAQIMHKYPDEKIVAVVGAGHEEELIEMIKKNLTSLRKSI